MSPRPSKFRFYLDENFPAPAGKFLKSKGHNVFEVSSSRKLRQLSDREQIKEACRHQRILLALDKDFRQNKSLLGEIRRSPGIILIQSSDPRSEKIVQIMNRLLRKNFINKIQGKICRASIDKISII